MAPVIAELGKHGAEFSTVVCATGQHREMLTHVLDLFEIEPDIDLDVMRPDQCLSQLTAVLLTSLDRVICDVKPDWVVAQGDTTSVFVAALAAFYRGIRFGHVEAGLRTGDRLRPFPEEVNRRIADQLAALYFAPTVKARDVLLAEGVSQRSIHVTGNTVIDALLEVARRPFDWAAGSLAILPRDRRLVLITAHRRESFGQPIREVCRAIRALSAEFEGDGIHFVYPVHMNPNVRQPVNEFLSGLSNVSLIEPLDYLSLVHLMKRSTLILTDSGGIQEEAPSLGVPVLVLRDTTERPEGLESGGVRLVGTSGEKIFAEAKRLLCEPAAHAAMCVQANPYGDGHAAQRIVTALLEYESR